MSTRQGSRSNHGSRRRRNRQRIARLTIFGAAALALAISPLWATVAHHALGSDETVEVQVKHGDTLWELANTYGPPDADPRRTVSRIARLNGLGGSVIHPGDILAIPTN